MIVSASVSLFACNPDRDVIRWIKIDLFLESDKRNNSGLRVAGWLLQVDNKTNNPIFFLFGANRFENTNMSVIKLSFTISVLERIWAYLTLKKI